MHCGTSGAEGKLVEPKGTAIRVELIASTLGCFFCTAEDAAPRHPRHQRPVGNQTRCQTRSNVARTGRAHEDYGTTHSSRPARKLYRCAGVVCAPLHRLKANPAAAISVEEVAAYLDTDAPWVATAGTVGK